MKSNELITTEIAEATEAVRGGTSSYNWELDCVGFTKLYEEMMR